MGEWRECAFAGDTELGCTGFFRFCRAFQREAMDAQCRDCPVPALETAVEAAADFLDEQGLHELMAMAWEDPDLQAAHPVVLEACRAALAAIAKAKTDGKETDR